jgi:hypothetical protein
MPMPKTTVHLNDYTVAAQNDVRASGKPSLMKSKAEAHCMNHLTDQHFRLSVLLADASHNS